MNLCCTLSVIPHISLSCLMLCHSFSPSYLPQVFAPRVLLVVRRGARCTFVILSGPVWAQGGASQRTGTVLLSRRIPVNEGYCREWGRRRRVKGAKTGGDQSLSWGSRVCARVTAESTDCLPSPPPPPPPPPVLSRPVPWGAAGQANAPAWNPHPPGPDAYLPHLKGFTETLHVPHWCPLTLF